MNVVELLTGDLCRLRFIPRFQLCHRIHDESVAEHSFYCATYALLLAMDVESQGYVVDVPLVVTKALLHDAEECITGDIPRPVRYHSTEFAEAIDEFATNAFAVLINNLGLRGSVVEKIILTWEYAKKGGDLESEIVRFADFLCVLSYLALEVEGSNKTMQRHVTEMNKYLGSFRYEMGHPLYSAMNQAHGLLNRVMKGA